MLALPPFDLQATDSYFVVAHFHYVMGGGALLAFFGATYYWFPKITGKMLSERLGKWVFVLVAGGLHVIFLPQHFVGLMGMPRRTQTYFEGYGFEIWNLISTLGVFIALSQVLCCLRMTLSARSETANPLETTPGTLVLWNGQQPLPRLSTTSTPHLL